MTNEALRKVAEACDAAMRECNATDRARRSKNTLGGLVIGLIVAGLWVASFAAGGHVAKTVHVTDVAAPAPPVNLEAIRSCTLPSNLGDGTICKASPDWDAMSKDQCATVLDTAHAARGMKLNEYDMFRMCDHLTKGYGSFAIARPRQGTAAGERMNECVNNYYRHRPVTSQYTLPKSKVEMYCFGPGR